MDAPAWNARYPVGTWIIITLANRQRRLTRSSSAAVHIGHHDFIQVEAIQTGYVLLRWCWPLKACALRVLALRLAR